MRWEKLEWRGPLRPRGECFGKGRCQICQSQRSGREVSMKMQAGSIIAQPGLSCTFGKRSQCLPLGPRQASAKRQRGELGGRNSNKRGDRCPAHRRQPRLHHLSLKWP